MSKVETDLIWTVETRKVSELKNLPNNPRTISKEAFDSLLEKIKRNNNNDILKIDVDNTVISGNQRLRAFEVLEIEEVEVKVPSRKLTKEEIDDNVLTSNISDGAWDFDLLANEYDFSQLEKAGFDQALLDKMIFPDLEKEKEKMLVKTFEVVIDCKDEADQERVYNLLQGQGIDCKCLTL